MIRYIILCTFKLRSFAILLSCVERQWLQIQYCYWHFRLHMHCTGLRTCSCSELWVKQVNPTKSGGQAQYVDLVLENLGSRDPCGSAAPTNISRLAVCSATPMLTCCCYFIGCLLDCLCPRVLHLPCDYLTRCVCV